jgi:EmrB/QacA subfamily drug resistance transporter
MTTETELNNATAEAVAPPESAEDKPAWGALVVVLAGLFITGIDFFIVNVAIPSLQLKMHATAAQIQFVSAGFNIGLSAMLIIGGRMGDLYGRRKIFSIGVAIFTLASLACGLAPNMGELIAARAVQGVAAAMVIPQVLGILTTAYAGKARVAAFNAYALTLGASAIFGQLIGGLLIKANIDNSDWRSIFLINVPLGVLIVLLAPRVVPESKAEGRQNMDVLGALLVTAGLTAIVLPLVEGRQEGWPTWTWECLAASVPLLAAFWWVQSRLSSRGKAPLINPSLFRDRSFSIGVVSIFVNFMVMASFFLVLALYLQEGRGLSALMSGLLFAPLGLGFFMASGAAAKLAVKLGKQVLALGAIVMAVGYIGLAETVSVLHSGPTAWCIPAMVVVGAGMGLVVAPLISLILQNVSPEHAAAASGVFSTAQEMANAVGIAAVGAIFFTVAGHHGGVSGYPTAFSEALYFQAAILVVLAFVVQLLPGKAKAAVQA